jgi:hypothetical protein
VNPLLELPYALNGIPIFIHPLLPMSNPNKTLVFKRWHRKTCYAKRVQKKYIKQHGYGNPIECLQMPQGLFVSARVYQQIKAIGAKQC